MTIEDDARAAAEKRWPLSSHPSDRRLAERAGFIAGYKAGASRPTGETHDEDTLRKVYDALRVALHNPDTSVTDIVSAMQNAGILFRERAVKGDAKLLQNSEPAPADERGPLPIERFAKGMVDAAIALTNRNPAPVDEREALLRLIRDSAAWRFGAPDELAEAILASDVWRTRHPQPPEGEPSARDLLDAIYDPEEDDENDSVRVGFIVGQFERLRAARVADQEGEK